MQESFTTFLHLTVAISAQSHLLGQRAQKGLRQRVQIWMSGALDNPAGRSPGSGSVMAGQGVAGHLLRVIIAGCLSLGTHRECGQAKEEPSCRDWPQGWWETSEVRKGTLVGPSWLQRQEEPACGGLWLGMHISIYTCTPGSKGLKSPRVCLGQGSF